MNGLELSSVPNWQLVDNRWVPAAVDTTCPQCGRAVSLSVIDPTWDAARRTVSATSSCPSCRLAVWLWVIEPHSASEDRGAAGLVMYPPPGKLRNPLYGAEKMPERVLSLYRQALSVYNAKLWNVAVGCCRQTLEVTGRTLLPAYEVQDSIGGNLKRLANSIDAKRPILDLAYLIREGGRLLPCLAQTRDADEETAAVVVDLMECLLQYVFTLPREAVALRQKVEGTLGVAAGAMRRVG